MAAMNLSMLNRTESDLDSVEAELRALKERKFYLESQLSQINPLTNMRSATGESILDPSSRLKALESEYASLSAKYSNQHPDIVKIKREIEGLRAQTGQSASTQEQAINLTKKRSEYAALEGTGFPLIYIGYRRIQGANIAHFEKTMDELNLKI